MKIKHTYDLITSEGTTSDIIEVVMNAYKIENDVQIEKLAQQLKGNTSLDSCKNIFKYLVQNINYRADNDIQEIKSPARLVHDAQGDCKSYSVFTAVVLRYLGIKHFFRFTSYSNKKQATHVYIVAVINNKNYPIDAVAYVQAGRPFGTEVKYNYRCDMAQNTTKIAYLAGVNGSAIGNVDTEVSEYLNSDLFKIWTGDDNDITPAKGFLLSEWDKYWTVWMFTNSPTEKVEALNRLQYVGAMLRFYDENRLNAVQLYEGGFIFEYLIENKTFETNETDPKRRDFFSDDQAQAITELQNNIPYVNSSFTDFWNTNIVDANIDVDNINGIGAINDLRSDLKKTGGYYLYTYIPEQDAQKYGAEVYRKRLIQNSLLSLNKDVLVNSKKMTAAEIDNLIYSGCVTTWQGTPNTAVNYMQPHINSITVATILTIIKICVAAIGLIVGIIKAINSLKAVSTSTVESGVPSENEFNIPSTGGTGNNKPLLESGMSFILPLALLGGLFLSKSKK